MFSEYLRSLLQQPRLVFDRVYPSQTEQNFSVTDLRERRQRLGSAVSRIEGHVNAMRLDDDSFARKLIAQQGRFARIAGQDCIRVAKQPMRLKEKPEKLPPFETMGEWRIETL